MWPGAFTRKWPLIFCTATWNPATGQKFSKKGNEKDVVGFSDGFMRISLRLVSFFPSSAEDAGKDGGEWKRINALRLETTKQKRIHEM